MDLAYVIGILGICATIASILLPRWFKKRDTKQAKQDVQQQLFKDIVNRNQNWLRIVMLYHEVFPKAQRISKDRTSRLLHSGTINEKYQIILEVADLLKVQCQSIHALYPSLLDAERKGNRDYQAEGVLSKIAMPYAEWCITILDNLQETYQLFQETPSFKDELSQISQILHHRKQIQSTIKRRNYNALWRCANLIIIDFVALIKHLAHNSTNADKKLPFSNNPGFCIK